MKINNVQSPFALNTNTVDKNKPATTNGQISFKKALFEALNNVNSLQQESATATQKLATGEIEDLHQVMITAQKASIALNATIEIRNKVIEAYQEVMRMQV